MNLQSWNFWASFTASMGIVVGFVWGLIKWYHRSVAQLISKRSEESQRKVRVDSLDLRFKELENDVKAVRKELTPNGKNTQRIGDIAARTEEKVDNLTEFMTRYAEKVDHLEQILAEHLGYHKGADL
jgi:hypothetical protein